MQDAARGIPWLSLTWNNPSRLHTQQTYTGAYAFLQSVAHFQLQNNTQSATALQVKDFKFPMPFQAGLSFVSRTGLLKCFRKCLLGIMKSDYLHCSSLSDFPHFPGRVCQLEQLPLSFWFCCNLMVCHKGEEGGRLRKGRQTLVCLHWML